MIVVDTSVWVAALRTTRGREAAHLAELLEVDEVALPLPVRCEILLGSSRSDLPRLRRTLSALPVLEPKSSTWDLIDQWIGRSVASGQRFGFADLLIGALAADHGSRLWTLDADFERMEKLGLIRRYEPRTASG